ncbi:MAG: 30S ribosomal protein S5 [Calditrichia bacterium]
MKAQRINPHELELEEKVVHINRTAKVVKGGRRFGFSALVVVGDNNGHVGIGMGKAQEVINAISKATEKAKKDIVRVELLNSTIPYEVYGKFGAAKVILRPAAPGTGVIAGGPVRAICEAVGIKDILTKIIGSANPQNVVKATMQALSQLKTPGSIAQDRGITLKEVFRG